MDRERLDRLRRGVAFVVQVDVRLFCLRNRVEWDVRAVLVRLGVMALAAVVLVPPVAVVVGFLVGGWGVGHGIPVDATAGLVLGALAVQAVGRLLTGRARGTRIGVFAPPDVAVLRAFDVPLSAVLLVRFAAGTVARQVVVTAAGTGLLVGMHVAGGAGPPPAAVAAAVVLPLGAALGSCLLASVPPPRAARVVALVVGCAVAVGLGALAGAAGAAAVPGMSAVPIDDRQLVVWINAVGGASYVGVGGFGALVLVSGLLALVVGTLCRRDPTRWVPAVPWGAGAGTVGGERAPRILIVALAMTRASQGLAVAFRRIVRVAVPVGAFVLACGVVAPGLVPRFEAALPGAVAGREPLLAGSAGGLLLVLGVLGSAFVGSVAGPQVLMGQLRWRWEQGGSARGLAAEHLAGMLVVIAPPVLLFAVGLSLLVGDVSLLVYGASLAVGVCASTALGDLVTGGRQVNPDGTGDTGAQGLVAGLAALLAVQAPWLSLPEAAVVLGPVVSAGLFLVAGHLLSRRIAP